MFSVEFPSRRTLPFNVYKMYIRHRWRLIDVEMTSCVYWVCRDFSAQLFWIANAEAVARRCFVPKLFWKILQNSEKNACARDSFLIKLQEPPETLAQIFSCEFYEIFNNTFLWEHLWRLLLRTDAPKRMLCQNVEYGKLIWYALG